jgi:hypothetical protein
MLPFCDSTQSTKYDSSTKLIVGEKHFDPATSGWNLQVSSTATLYALLGTTNGSNVANGDIYFVPDVGSPSVIATLPTTSSLPAALVSVSVSAYFTSTAAAGTFQVRTWITTFNGNDQSTCYGAWIEVQP